MFLICYPAYAQTHKSVSEMDFTLQEDPAPIEISTYPNRIKVANAPIGSTLEIYSIVGIKVKEIEIKQSTAEYPLDLAKGYYIIRINDTVCKIAIR